MNKVKMLLFMSVGVLLLLAACAPKPAPTPTPAPTATPAPTPTPRIIVVTPTPGPTPTPTPTPTPGPTPTPRIVVVTPTPTPTPVIKGEGKVMFFGQATYEKFFLKDWLPMFETQTGCKLTFFGGGSDAMASRIQAEAAKPTVDVTEAMLSVHIKLKWLSLLEKNNPNIVTNTKYVFDFMLDPDDVGVPNRVAGAELGYRADILREKGIAPPTSWLDLAAPRFKGRVVAYSTTSPTGHYILAAIARLLGEDEKMEKHPKLWDWVEKELKPNASLVTAGTGPITLAFSEGSVWVGAIPSTAFARLIEDGVDVKWVDLPTGAILPPGFAEAVKGGPNPVCAQLLLNFLISKEFQQARAPVFMVAPVRADVTISPEDAKKVGTVERIKNTQRLDYEAIAVNERTWSMNWDRIFRK